MNHVDICSGIGGFGLAARRMGWKTIAFCEIDPFCRKVLRKNFGADMPVFNNLFTLNYASIKSFYRNKRGRSAPKIDIVTAGLPCQPFSQAGKRNGRSDKRHLFPAFMEFVQSANPRFIVIENVRGLLNIESGQIFAEIVARLESENYEVITFCVPASSIEAPHERDRTWLIAYAADERRVRRAEQSQIRERAIYSGLGIDQSFGKSSIDNSKLAGTFTDAERERRGKTRQLRRDEQTERASGGDQAFTDADSIERDGRRNSWRGWNESSNGDPITTQYGNIAGSWYEAATRFCRMDDGLSDQLDIAGSRDNRTHRIKALGNAIVPQIAYEIFSAIKTADEAKR